MPSICTRPIALSAALAALLAAFAPLPAAAQDFYAGRSIELLIGAPPGGGYDIYGRAVARHIGRHIPGNPNVVPKNMPGAGSRARGGLHQQRRSQGRHRHRQYHAGCRHRTRCSIPKRSDCSTRRRSCSLATSTMASASVCRASTRRSRPSRTRARSRPCSAADRRTIPPATMAICTGRPPAPSGTWSPATRARPTSRSRSSAARSTASVASTGRASSRKGRHGCATRS